MIRSRVGRVIYWLSLIAALSWFLYLRMEDAIAGRATTADTLIFGVWIALLLVPLFAEVELLGIKLKQVVEQAAKEVKEDVRREIASVKQEVLTAISVKTNVTANVYLSQGVVNPKDAVPEKGRQPMEWQILNTLWTQQVNKFPDRQQLFTFKMDFADPELNRQFAEAAGKLIGEKLIARAEDGKLFLTERGFEFALSNYTHFPSLRWWQDEKLDTSNLNRVLSSFGRSS